jgi:hypothetical protein
MTDIDIIRSIARHVKLRAVPSVEHHTMAGRPFNVALRSGGSAR